MRSFVVTAVLLLGCDRNQPPLPTTPAEPAETPAERLDRESCEKYGGDLYAYCAKYETTDSWGDTPKPKDNSESYERALDYVRSSYLAEGYFLQSEEYVTILTKELGGSRTFELSVAEGGDFIILVVTNTSESLGARMDIAGVEQVEDHLDHKPYEDQDVWIHATWTRDAAIPATIKFSLYGVTSAHGQLFIFTR